MIYQQHYTMGLIVVKDITDVLSYTQPNKPRPAD